MYNRIFIISSCSNDYALTDSRHLCVIFSFVLSYLFSVHPIFNSIQDFLLEFRFQHPMCDERARECVRERGRDPHVCACMRNRFDSLIDWRWHEMYYFYFRTTKSIEHCRQPEWVACTWTRCSPVFTCRIHKKNINNSDSERVRHCAKCVLKCYGFGTCMKFCAIRHTVYAFEIERKLIEMCAPIECQREINFRCLKPAANICPVLQFSKPRYYHGTRMKWFLRNSCSWWNAILCIGRWVMA